MFKIEDKEKHEAFKAMWAKNPTSFVIFIAGIFASGVGCGVALAIALL